MASIATEIGLPPTLLVDDASPVKPVLNCASLTPDDRGAGDVIALLFYQADGSGAWLVVNDDVDDGRTDWSQWATASGADFGRVATTDFGLRLWAGEASVDDRGSAIVDIWSLVDQAWAEASVE